MADTSDRLDRLRFASRAAWRAWLEAHHTQPESIWVVINKKATPPPGLYYEDAVLEALCFGWIDSTINAVDDDAYALRFSPRRRNSVWSVSNIERVNRLVGAGLMTTAGMLEVEAAQEDGRWQAAIERENVDKVPDDLAQALVAQLGAVDGYLSLLKSRRKQLLYWLSSAKRAATRARRIQAIVDEVRETQDNDASPSTTAAQGLSLSGR